MTTLLDQFVIARSASYPEQLFHCVVSVDRSLNSNAGKDQGRVATMTGHLFATGDQPSLVISATTQTATTILTLSAAMNANAMQEGFINVNKIIEKLKQKKYMKKEGVVKVRRYSWTRLMMHNIRAKGERKMTIQRTKIMCD